MIEDGEWESLRIEQEQMALRLYNAVAGIVEEFRGQLEKTVKEIERNWAKFMEERSSRLAVDKLKAQQEKDHAE
jgi:hypothetical protein